MQFPVEINGLPVEAAFSEENIHGIFLPLLSRLTALQKARGRRILVMLAAPPGAGKTTLSHFLRFLSRTQPGLEPLEIIGMDGFHRPQAYLKSHFVTRGGKELPMVQIKGAPETFDLPHLRERIERVAAGEFCGWPLYNRLLHDPEDDAMIVNGSIVLLEGNYLLLDEEGWRDLHRFADYTLQIKADPALLRPRLIRRKAMSGLSKQEAEAFVESSDLMNARRCLKSAVKADLTLRLKSDGTYEKDENADIV